MSFDREISTFNSPGIQNLKPNWQVNQWPTTFLT